MVYGYIAYGGGVKVGATVGDGATVGVSVGRIVGDGTGVRVEKEGRLHPTTSRENRRSSRFFLILLHWLLYR
jgi:hypothetical protein